MTKVLDRDLSRAQVAEIKQLGGPPLRGAIDEGAGVFERCSQTAPDGDENLGILFPFHHILEMADGVEILLGESGVAASIPLLRSAFEGLLGLKYVLADDTERRALCYALANLKARIEWYEWMDPETESGRRYREDIGFDDKPDYPFPPPETVRKAKTQLESLLESDLYADHAREFERIRKKRGRVPQWYSLYGGPAHLRELSERTGDLDNYTVLYKEWSKTTHGVDLSRQLVGGGDGAAIRVIRSPEGIDQRYHFAITFVVQATRCVLGYYRRDELKRYAAWFMGQISRPLGQLEQLVLEEARRSQQRDGEGGAP